MSFRPTQVHAQEDFRKVRGIHTAGTASDCDDRVALIVLAVQERPDLQGAQVLGDSTVGALRAGLWADVVVTDAELRPVTVLRRGEVVEPAA